VIEQALLLNLGDYSIEFIEWKVERVQVYCLYDFVFFIKYVYITEPANFRVKIFFKFCDKYFINKFYNIIV